MLRRLLILGLLAAMALPSHAAKRLSVAQLEQVLTADASKHKQDIEIAEQLAGMALTERIPESTIERLTAQLAANPRASLVFRVLANEAEFLDLPRAESVAESAPEPIAQKRMLEAARDYVSETLARLPNLLATRTINLYDDTPHAIKQGGWPTRLGLHQVGTSRAEISVLREREDQPPTQGSAVWQSKIGLVSGGEFGTTLGMIFADSAKGDVHWSNWERSSTGLLAVFAYSVPAPVSHFEVITSFQREENVEAFSAPTGERGVSGIATRPNVSSTNVAVVHTRPAYHGAIWLDPATGTIHRITMEADMKKDLPFRRAAILVEYGPIEIAGARFICPVRSLALSESLPNTQSLSDDAATEWLNEILFTDYHRFASSARITEQAAAAPAPQTAPSAASTAGHASQATNAAQSTNEASDQTSTATPLQAPPTTLPALPSPESGTPVIQPSASVESDKAANPQQPPPALPGQAEFTLQVNVDSLLVPAVVLDNAGHAVGGLVKENFVILDEGQSRTITGLTLVKTALPVESGNLRPTTGSATPRNVSVTASAPIATANRFLVFLFDDRHMTADDLPIVQKAATRLFDRPLPETDSAAVLSFMGVNSGITRDSATLQSAITKLAVHQAFQHGKEDCPDVDYYSADQIIRQHNPMEFQIAVQEAKQCSFLQESGSASVNIYDGMSNPQDPFQKAAMAAASHALVVGEEDARESLLSVRNIIRVMAKLPGQRVLIFVSPGFLSLSPESMALKSEIMDSAAASDVIVNSLDARGLYAGNVDASQGGNTSTLARITGQPVQNKLASMQASENALSELAAGTGGRFFHNSNDLQGGLQTLTAAPENLYLLDISLKDAKHDGAYHRLQVKVDRPGLHVLARKGYFAPSKTLRKKNPQTIVRP